MELRTVLVVDGRVAVESSALSILDASSGEIVFSDADSPFTRVHEVPDGILVGRWFWRIPRKVKYGLLPEDGRHLAWSVDCEFLHSTDEHLICTEPSESWRLLGRDGGDRVICRSLEDGRVLWSHETIGRIGKALDGKGRLMLTNEDWYSAEDEDGGRVTNLEIIELATGRILATTEVDDVMLASWPEYCNHEFDGDHVLMRQRRAMNPDCPESAVRIYTLDLSRQAFSAHDDCEPTPLVTQRDDCVLLPPPAPVVRERTDEEKRRGARIHALEDGEVVVSPRGGTGFMLELRSKRGRWQAFLEEPRRNSGWEFRKVFEREGLVFIESSAWDFGTLDCIELTSGRPLWRFFYRAEPVLASTSCPFGPPKSYLVQEGYQQRSLFRDLETSPPPGVAVVSDPVLMEQENSYHLAQQAKSALTAPQKPTFEPFPTLRLVRWAAFVWVLVSLGIITIVGLMKKRFATPGSARRVWIALGLLVYLAAILVVFGRIEYYAAATAKLLLVAVFMQAAFYVFRVQVRRARWLVRSAFGVSLIPLAFLVLFVVVLM